MKKVYFTILLLILSFLPACSGDKTLQKTDNLTTNEVKQTITNFTGGNNTSEKMEIKLTDFDKEIIKLALKKGDKMCNQLSKNKIDYCKDIIKEEKNNLSKLNCDKLKFLKQECLDKLNLKKRQCEKIKDEYLKRKCVFQKKYDEAVKNKDLNFCNSLPKKDIEKCRKKILTK